MPPLLMQALPPALRNALASAGSRPLTLYELASENSALSTPSSGVIDTTTTWLATTTLQDDHAAIAALVDWETAHIDPPAGDLGYVRPVIEPMVLWRDFFERHVAAGGHPISSRQNHFFGIWDILRINIQLRHCRQLYETGATDDPMLGEVGAYCVPRFVHRISQHLRRALHDAE